MKSGLFHIILMMVGAILMVIGFVLLLPWYKVNASYSYPAQAFYGSVVLIAAGGIFIGWAIAGPKNPKY